MNTRKRATQRANRWTPWPVNWKHTIAHYEIQPHRKKRIQKKWTKRFGYWETYRGAYISAIDWGGTTDGKTWITYQMPPK